MSYTADDTLIERWNGVSWKIFPSPNSCTFERCGCFSATSAWAVGQCDNGGRSRSRSLILHWDGVHWRKELTPSLGGGNNRLTAVRAVSSTEAWAVGSQNVGSAVRSLVLHFTGGQWHKVRIMNVNINDSLSAVTATSATDVWAVVAHVQRCVP